MKFAHSLIAVALSAAALSAHADSVTPLTTPDWNTFYFADAGSHWLDDFAANAPGNLSFSLSLSGPAWLKVTDLGTTGDVFEVFDNGRSLGLTSAPQLANTQDIGIDFDAAFASRDWSHGQWLLGAGTHVITGLVSRSPVGAGIGGLQVTAVPEPDAYALLLAGLGLLGWAARRRAVRGESVHA
ncbi:PEP-CTERM sorting domain-containing protein [Rhodocyclus tenuis]|uniref:PEP-CTERM sorting domain-containing protein n=2 Tax=Rhodocyclus TaxID=1064 RepID=A0A6L5JUA9_RHOTE|nr:FxDxF family PEP-CTERM protein [Rhodocyclus gracilis]MQY50641.1 PEP-CTERM sorting domain-containing protein [Rhodocyclus gracilis]NJA88170.1 PEP-CTERM sorting domain-containing protein [Rhodocyclus gracilis]